MTEVTSFRAKLDEATERADSLVCIGLDVDTRKFPAHLNAAADPGVAIVRFNAAIIEATSDLVCAYKPNFAFYLPYGAAGLEALLETRRLIPAHIPVILDCKVGDMGATAEAYARAFFGEWDFDAITASPYMGEDALAPYLKHAGRGVIVLCKTSNPGSGEFQDLTVDADQALYRVVAEHANAWERRYPASVGLVAGATHPGYVAAVREVSPDLPILLPGVGSQAGEVEASVRGGIDRDGRGLMVSASRSVIYAGDGLDFAEKARAAAATLRDEVNAFRDSRVAV